MPKREPLDNQRIPFETKVRDKYTGLEGIVTGISRYVTGCDQYLLTQPVDKDGKHVTAHWTDDHRLTVVEKAPKEPIVEEQPAEKRGAGEPAPVR